MPYNYFKRRIETCQAKRQARGVETAINLSNIIEQYTRPKLVHVGPQPIHLYDGTPYEWPWVHLDEADTERNVILECASMFPIYPQQEIDISMFLIASQLGNGFEPVNPMEAFSTIDLKIDVNTYTYVDSTSTAVLLSTDRFTFSNESALKAYLAMPENANKAALNVLAEGYNINSFDEDVHLTGENIRNWVLYETTNDLELITPISMTISMDIQARADVEGITFQQIRNRPFFIDIEVASIGADITYNDLFNKGGRLNQAPSAPDLRRSYYTRIFNVGSEFRVRGVL